MIWEKNEGGIRVPFLVRWPGVVPAGVVSEVPVCSVDLFPTILEMAGVGLPEEREIDGVSLVEFLKSGGKKKLGRDELLWHFPHYRHAPGPYSIIRKGDQKLIKFWEGSFELYDLGEDLGEEKDLAASMPERVEELDRMLVERLEGMGAKLPRVNLEFVEKM